MVFSLEVLLLLPKILCFVILKRVRLFFSVCDILSLLYNVFIYSQDLCLVFPLRKVMYAIRYMFFGNLISTTVIIPLANL